MQTGRLWPPEDRGESGLQPQSGLQYPMFLQDFGSGPAQSSLNHGLQASTHLLPVAFSLTARSGSPARCCQQCSHDPEDDDADGNDLDAVEQSLGTRADDGCDQPREPTEHEEKPSPPQQVDRRLAMSRERN